MAVFDSLNTSYSSLLRPSLVQFHERTLLKNVRDNLIYTRDLTQVTLPAHHGNTIQFRRARPFGPVSEPLKEGVTPSGQLLAIEELYASISSYGRHIELTDEVDWKIFDNIQRIANEEMAYQAQLTIDTIVRDKLMAGLNVLRPNNRATRGAIVQTDILTYDVIKQAVLTLQRNRARPFSDGYYHAIVGPDTVFDLTSDPNWVAVARAQNESKFEKYLLGSIYNVKFYQTTNDAVYRASPYLYYNTQDNVPRASLSITSYDATTHAARISDTNVTTNQAAQLTGMLVNVGGKLGQIDRVQSADLTRDNVTTIYFRWDVAISASTTAPVSVLPVGGGASGVPVFGTLVYGQDFGACIDLEGGGRNVQVIIKPLGSSGAEDPLNQRQTIAWKIKGFTATILQDAFCVRIEHACSQTTS
jgi:N4-gp56 family major capsid protein